MNHSKYLNYLFLLFLLFISCNKSSVKDSAQKSKTETFEIYDTKGDVSNAEAGDLKYFESSDYKGKKLLTTSYFDAKGELTGKEIFNYPANDSIAIGSTYYDKAGKILSSYKYINDDAGNKIASYGFDANGQLIRIEAFTYRGDKVTIKRVFEADYKTYRSYEFAYDNFGNETGLKVYDGDHQIILDEEFKIVSKDKDNKWLEKWGFAGGKPMTYHKRKG